MANREPVLETALAAERLRASHQLALFRLIAVSTFLALSVLFLLSTPGWLGPMGPLTIYWLVCLVLYVGVKRSTRIARSSEL